MIELTLVLSAASLIIGGISVKASDILSEARDVAHLANLRQLATVLELYYVDHQQYPQASAAAAGERFETLLSELNDYLINKPLEKEKYDYAVSDNSQNYLLKVSLENPDSPYLKTNKKDQKLSEGCGVDYYCLGN